MITADEASISSNGTTAALAIAHRLSTPDVPPDIEAELVDRLAGIEASRPKVPADVIARVSRITAMADELAALPIGHGRAPVIVRDIEAATTAAVAALLGVDR